MSAQIPEQTGTSAVPVCPRHPGVVSYVRCQRCGRPACAQCQRPAAVGIQCVDCVREAQARLPSTRTVFGGRARHGRPVVTLTIIGICVAVYLLVAVFGGSLQQHLVFAPGVGDVQPYRFLTSAFLHGGVLHLALNMYALWIVGSVVEPALGRWRYAALYLLSALGGSVAVLLLASPDNSSWFTAVVGASGAVFGLFAAIFLVLRRLGRDATQILVLIALNFGLGFVVAGISWQAHLGGAVVGAVLAASYVYAPRERSTLVSGLATAGMFAVLVVLTMLKYALA
ncbi:rhomboid family intramembrane serine protease [Georgenia yuyongxinii]|uniref:Rhomboid family intramembrane serine protease n=1 Tax=Georgenia yuyongxinii TaxID=2589797 RepID=A0A552WJU5_9MICO|nr:rhomboid family intramembrane serine protease [Georgenia yuyongxinii]TRW43035.1 rhomboid family intramembrane serine protease [Georgenia yuyongxinii]